LIWEAGVLALQAEPGNTVQQAALYYLLTHNGEAGHMCSIACTSGMIRVLQQVGSEAVKAKFLPPLLDPRYEQMQHAAQFLTEVQGGSDVGANAVVARDYGDGTWRITGEKWFCSNINADQFLLTARPEGATDGTRGLGLFVVPRRLEDGSINHFYIRRLKDKLGTRTLPSAEVDFVEAVAYPVGALDRGFKNVVEFVLNTSRLLNAISCAGVMRRAAIEAGGYACAREAFGEPIIRYPLVQEAIADIRVESYAAVASCFALAHLLDKIETGNGTEDDQAVYRMLVNINKYITSIRGSEMVHRAIEVLGGNGAIESFSILPRLYRDMVVLESWEGTHNVLCLQVWRDMQRYHLHEAFFRFMEGQLAHVRADALQVDLETIWAVMDDTRAMIERLQRLDETAQQAHIRRLIDRLGYLAQAILMLGEAQWELEHSFPTDKPDVIRYFVNRHLQREYDPLDDPDYLPRLERLASGI
jgi:alkylation response protein AidB-like acyl-CoA dehydrogenase